MGEGSNKFIDSIESLFRAVLSIMLYLVPAIPVLYLFDKLNTSKTVYQGVYSAIVSLLTICLFIGVNQILKKSNDSFIVRDRLDIVQVMCIIVIALGLVGMVYCYLTFADVISDFLESLKDKIEEYNESVDRLSEVEQYHVPLWDSILYIFDLTILIPFSEELVFRGAVLGSLKRGFRPWLAIVLSAVIFGLMHGISMHIGYAVICGLVMGAVYHMTNSIFASFLIHSIFNFLGSCIPFFFDLQLFGVTDGLRYVTVRAMWYGCIGMMLPAIFAYILLLTRYRMKTGKNKALIETKAEEKNEQA